MLLRDQNAKAPPWPSEPILVLFPSLSPCHNDILAPAWESKFPDCAWESHGAPSLPSQTLISFPSQLRLLSHLSNHPWTSPQLLQPPFVQTESNPSGFLVASSLLEVIDVRTRLSASASGEKTR